MDTYTGFVKTVLVQQLTGFSGRTATGCRPSVAYRTSGGSRIFERGYRFRWITAIARVVTLCQARRHYTSMQRLQSSQLFGMKCGNFLNLGSLKSHLLAFEVLYNKHWSCAAVSAGPIPLPLYNMCIYNSPTLSTSHRNKVVMGRADSFLLLLMACRTYYS